MEGMSRVLCVWTIVCSCSWDPLAAFQVSWNWSRVLYMCKLKHEDTLNQSSILWDMLARNPTQSYCRHSILAVQWVQSLLTQHSVHSGGMWELLNLSSPADQVMESVRKPVQPWGLWSCSTSLQRRQTTLNQRIRDWYFFFFMRSSGHRYVHFEIPKVYRSLLALQGHTVEEQLLWSQNWASIPEPKQTHFSQEA